MKNFLATKKFLLISIIFFILSAIFMDKGYDKMTNYYSSEYSSLNVNAYVGGDAYNYIINGTYATAFFVLSMGFLISGLLTLHIELSKPKTASKDSLTEVNTNDLLKQFEMENKN